MHNTAQTPFSPSASGPVWSAPLLDQSVDDAIEAWKCSIHGFAKRLDPRKRAEFIMGFDTAMYFMAGESAIAANGGRHPKHDILDYHNFFIRHIQPTDSVLDLGCGKGELAVSIALQAGARVTGMDWCERSLSQARLNAGAANTDRVEYHVGDITTHSLAHHFDTIVLSNVLEHIALRTHRLRMWNDWYTPRQFLIRVPAHDRDWRTGWKDQLGIDSRCDPTHEIEYTSATLQSELHEAGLCLQSCSTQWGEYWCVAIPVDQAIQRSLSPDHTGVKQ